MRALVGIVAALLLLPSAAFAAGFAKQSLFLSESPVIEGDSVLIHAVMANDDASAFSGELVFYSRVGSDPKTKIGSVAVSISPGGASTESVSWKPAAGTYAIFADLTAQDGSVVQEESIQVVVDPKPEPPPTAPTPAADGTVGSSQNVQQAIANVSPQAASAAAPAFAAVDTFRVKAAGLLGAGIDWSKQKIGVRSPGEVLGASTQNPTPQGLAGVAWYIVATIALYACTALLWVVDNAGIFYPVLAFLFLFGLWKMYRAMRRPAY